MTPAIELQDISKRFITTSATKKTLQEIFLAKLRRSLGSGGVEQNHPSGEFWALQNVSFAVPAGETFGLIGHNGAGKSSLLKLISGVLRPTSGKITVNGRISALLELGAGFHPDLTGRENIFLNGSILGLSRQFLEDRLEETIDFTELGHFIDMPVKHYSSGMSVRLGFAIATSIDPQILLVDEVLAVGDLAFQAKCIARIDKMKAAGTTILFVSHDPELVLKLCDQVLWLERGQVQMTGPSDVVIKKYKKVMMPSNVETSSPAIPTGVAKRWGSRAAEITTVRFLNATGNSCQEFETGQPFTAEIHYRAHQPIKKPAFGIAIYRQDGVHVNGTNTAIDHFFIDAIEGEGCVHYHLAELPLLTGHYQFTAAIYDHESVHPYDHHHRMYNFSVRQRQQARRLEGLVFFPARWQHHIGMPETIEIEML